MAHFYYNGSNWMAELKKHFNTLSQDEIWIVPSVHNFSFIQELFSNEEWKQLKKERKLSKNGFAITISDYAKNPLGMTNVPVLLNPTNKETAELLCYIKQKKTGSSYLYSNQANLIYEYFSKGATLTLSDEENAFIKKMEAIQSYPESFVEPRAEKEFKAIISEYINAIDKEKMVAYCILSKYPTIAFIDGFMKQLGVDKKSANIEEKKSIKWEDVKNKLNANVCNNLAILCYQGCDDLTYCGAAILNHCLNIEHYGEAYQSFSDEDGEFASLEDYENYQDSKKEMSKAFCSDAVCWNNLPVLLYKGVNEKAFYKFLHLEKLKEGNSFFLPGYCSMTTNETVATHFADNFMLVCENMGMKKCVFPPNKTVNFSKAQGQNEEEILFDCGINFRINRIEKKESLTYLYIEPC